jgi:hypothetical protein
MHTSTAVYITMEYIYIDVFIVVYTCIMLSVSSQALSLLQIFATSPNSRASGFTPIYGHVMPVVQQVYA